MHSLTVTPKFLRKLIFIFVFNTSIVIAGFILSQNDDGPLKWADGPYSIQIHANFQILMGHSKFLWALYKI